MKKTIIKLFDKVILLILGSTAVLYCCCDYGAPVDEFEIKGTVTDRASEPIQNIRIIKQNYDTLYTNSEGKYSFQFWGPNQVRLKVEDIDGEENGGEFSPIELDVKFTDADRVKKGRGNKTGDVYVKTQNIKLHRIDEIQPEYGPPAAPFEP